MKTSTLLDQLLKSGRSMLESAGNSTGGSLKGALSSDLGRGALMGGALGLLLGNKRIRKLGGNALAYGGMAALGAVAYRTYSEWQRNRTDSVSTATPASASHPSSPADTENRGRAVLKALIAAAKSDGHIEDRERELIEAEMARLDNDSALQSWLDAELRRPLDPTDVAQAATSPELAAEMYLISLLATDDQSPMERLYLDELARQLRLDPTLKAQLETQAQQPL